MCLCLAQSLIENKSINKKDHLDVLDIGICTSNSILLYENSGNIKSNLTQDRYSGNGSTYIL